MKVCNKCEVEKSLEDFRLKKVRGTYKPNSVCKACESEQKKEHYLINKSSILNRRKEKRATPEAKEKRVTPEAKEKRKKYLSKYLEENKKEIKEKLQKYYKENREQLLKKASEYKKTKDGKISSRASSGKRRNASLGNADGTITKHSLDTLLQIQNNQCFYCKKDLSLLADREVHLDHYIPLSKGGAHSITNVVWSCSSCNLQKSSAIPDTELHLEHIECLQQKLETGPRLSIIN